MKKHRVIFSRKLIEIKILACFLNLLSARAYFMVNTYVICGLKGDKRRKWILVFDLGGKLAGLLPSKNFPTRLEDDRIYIPV